MNSSTADYPIVLARGICHSDGLARMALGPDRKGLDAFSYFRKIPGFLEEHGYRVYQPAVSWAGSLERRARNLRDELVRITEDFTRHERVHIVAHSMGGLDSRMMIARYGLHEHVASLSTISTPHLGTTFANWGIRNLDRVVDLVGRLGVDIGGFRDLTTWQCRRFNEQTKDYESRNGVKYRTYAGVQSYDRVCVALRFPHRMIQRKEGPNDGLVSLKSARWREDLFVKQIEADHLNEIGWWDVRDTDTLRNLKSFEKRIQNFYLDIVESL
mgnify:FL=1